MMVRPGVLALLIALFLVSMAVVACQPASVVRPSSSEQSVGAASTPPAVATAEVSVASQPLASVWAAWDILRKGYIDRQRLDPVAMSQAATDALVKKVGLQSLAQTPLPAAKAKPPREMPKELRPLWEGWASVHENYSGSAPLDDGKLGREVITAFVRSLEDPHTEYVEPEQFPTWSQDFYGNFGGIGAEVHARGGKFLLNPLPNGPAEKAGLKPGDALVAVEGESVDGWSLLRVVGRIRGKRGTPVSLTLVHLGNQEPVTLSIIRDTIKLESVFWNMTNDGFAYIKLAFFYENTPEALDSALREALDKGARAIVLDLRNNPGGFLRATADVASQFVGDALVVYEMDAAGKRSDWSGKSRGLARDLPMVVLVNQFTASGSEVLAGALRDYDRARLVGVTTFGKGSVNQFQDLPDGGGLYYTIGRWYTPKGTMIEGQGLEPDERVAAVLGTRTGDSQLEKALDLLRQEIAASAASR